MNKPLVAAITGVAFGIVLTGSLIHMRNSSRARMGCPHRAAMLQRPVVVEVQHFHTEIVEPASPPNALDYDRVLTEAQTQYVNGNYETAVSMARTVQDKNPVRAWRIMGAAACNTKDLKLANESFKKLDAPGRQYLVYVCQRNGMQRGKRSFSIEE